MFKTLPILKILAFSLMMLAFHTVTAQTPPVPDNQVIMCLLPLDHANAEELAGVLAPFLSSSGTITPYPPTNALIIKDRTSVVRNLIKVVKGKADLEECQNLRLNPINYIHLFRNVTFLISPPVCYYYLLL